jgi:hypothetical protein
MLLATCELPLKQQHVSDNTLPCWRKSCGPIKGADRCWWFACREFFAMPEYTAHTGCCWLVSFGPSKYGEHHFQGNVQHQVLQECKTAFRRQLSSAQ